MQNRHFRSHAAKIKKQRIQQALQSLPDSSPIPDFQYRDILIFKDNVDEAKKEKYCMFINTISLTIVDSVLCEQETEKPAR